MKKKLLSLFSILSISYFVIGKDKKKEPYALFSIDGEMERLECLGEALNDYSINFIKPFIKKNCEVLEIGCGVGFVTQKIAKILRKGKITAIDFSEQKIQIAIKLLQKSKISKRDKNKINFKVLSAYNIEELNKKYDIVYIRAILIHLEDPVKVISEAKKVLKPNGVIIIEELMSQENIYSIPEDSRINHVKQADAIQEQIQKTDFSIGNNLDKILCENNFNIIAKREYQAELKTDKQRKNFSLGMLALKQEICKANYISSEKMDEMIDDVKTMEHEKTIKLFFYKIMQIAATPK